MVETVPDCLRVGSIPQGKQDYAISSAHDRTEFPLLIAIRSSGKPAVAVVDQVKAAAKERFVRKLGMASAAEMEQISDALAVLVGMD